MTPKIQEVTTGFPSKIISLQLGTTPKMVRNTQKICRL